MMIATVHFAVETLRMLYGRPEIIHHALQKKLKEEPPVRRDKLDTFIHFALAVQNYRMTMQAMGLTDYLNEPMLLNELVEKLPCDLKLDWGRYRFSILKVDITIFDSWLFSLATCVWLLQLTMKQKCLQKSGSTCMTSLIIILHLTW